MKLFRICLSRFSSRCHFFRCGLVVVVPGEDDLRILRRKDLVERLLIERAGFAIDAYEKGLVAERFDVLPVVIRDILSDLLDAFLALEKVLEVDGAVENFVEFLDVR